MFRKSCLIILLILLFACSSSAGELSATTQTEINHLFNFIKTSDCDFYRNGTWYPAKEAVNHIEKKYNYFMKKDKITSAETFIKYSATESTMSGKKYQVKCGNSPEIESATWLKKELSKFRSK